MNIDLNLLRMEGRDEQNGLNILHGLNDLCKKHITAQCVVLELGCNAGASARLFSEYAKHVHTLDSKPEPKIFTEYKNITHHRGDFYDILPSLKKEPVDFIYIDGVHFYSGVKKDILMCLSLFKNLKAIGGHDYNAPKSEVKEVVQDIFKTEPETFSDFSWYLKLT